MLLLCSKRGVTWRKKHKYGKLVIDLQIKTQALEQGLNTAKQKLKEIENSNKSLENSNKSLDASFIAMSASIVTTLYGIGNAIKTCVDEYNSYTQAMSGLQNIASYTGQDMNKLTQIMQKFMKYGLTQTDIATAIKNFSLMGYTAEETEQMIMALTESAISNRQACYSVSEAVRMASEGYKNGISTLSDAAGVTENLSVMESKYAESIGKTVGQLTEAEKNQAYLNRTMEAAAPFAGATAQYMETLAGKQGEYSQALRETQVAYAEAMEPTLVKIEEFKTRMLTTLTDFITQNEEATEGVTVFVTTLGTLTVAVLAVRKAIKSYTEATGVANATTQTFTASLLKNPLFIGGLAISAVVATLNALNSKIEESIEKLEEAGEKAKSIGDLLNNWSNNDMTYTEEETTQANEIINQAKQETAELMEELRNRQQQVAEINREIQEEMKLETPDEAKIDRLNNDLGVLQESISTIEGEINRYNKAVDTLNKTLEMSNSVQKYLTNTNTKAHRETLIDIAQTKADIAGKQSLLDILKKGKTTTDEYADAKSQLVKVYPELAKVNENTIASTQATIDAENAAADAAWVNAQTAIQASILEVSAMMSNSEQIIIIANATKQSVEEVTASLQNQMDVLSNLAKLTPEDFKGSVTTTYIPRVSTPSYSSSSASVYENKKLDDYKALIEYKKSLDQISLKQEIVMYEKALNSYAKTTEEKRELRTKIYELNKEMAQKEKDLLDQQTEDYETYIQEQKNLRGAAYDVAEQTKDYDAIIKMHKNYLKQIMKDERLSLDERKELYREELQTIRDYEQQKRDLRVESIDNAVSQLTDAVTQQLEEMQEKDKEMIDKNLEEVEKWKDARINAINEEYDARIEAIDKELEALNKAEEQKSRDEEDSEYEQKRKRLEELIAFEHDATNRANYQKELDKLIADYQKTLDERALQDKKDMLEEQKDKIQEEQDAQIEAIENEADKRKESYEQQLDELEKYYDEQMDMAQQTAEKMLLNVEDNQKQILNLLKNYGDAYEITGQSLGEKLAQGINEGVAKKIQNVIQKIQDTIDTNIENKLKEWTNGSYSYEAGTNKPQVTSKTVNVYQTNNIEQNPELPSETYRKLKAVDEQLAAQLLAVM